jgi:hypothetical protein
MATTGLFGARLYGAGIIGGSSTQRLLAGAAISGETVVMAAAGMRIRPSATALSGEGLLSSTYSGLPTNVAATALPLQGNSNALVTVGSQDVTVGGSLIVVTVTDKSTSERMQFGRAGNVVV